ncbi:ROK [Ostreococcus tauri]|uniref:fructokinase n=2 Tax=Ostreococcus tauri TaxID=70448 RepID=Q014K2_OSTTA|nr:ROK [Ostreococcus tauri]CAL54677.1 ROK [Ostreococcus tauri]|eukprot:XP_003080510.1 ROK [Ostreococcus tauri]
MGAVKLLGIEGGGTTWTARATSIDVDAGDSMSATTVSRVTTDVPRECVTEVFNTTTPTETLGAIRAWIEVNARDADAIGVATFGPVELNPAKEKYGYITTTPKPGWEDVDVLGALFGPRGEEEGGEPWVGKARLKTPNDVPLAFDTDVNAPAALEHRALRRELQNVHRAGGESCCYVTVGTGVGVGVVANGRPVHGMLHPEAGHMHVRMMDDETFPGTCPFHGNCVEGMCGSNALAKRRGVKPADLVTLPDDDEIWDQCAHYLAGLCANLILTLAPERIVLGGGVMQRECLFSKIRAKTRELLNGYLSVEQITDDDHLRHFIVPPAWGYETGINSALFLAENALKREVA